MVEVTPCHPVIDFKIPLPSGGSTEEDKVFHLIRQVYGQMTLSKLKYGIFHVMQCGGFAVAMLQASFKFLAHIKRMKPHHQFSKQ